MIFRPLLHGSVSSAENIFATLNTVLLAISLLALWLYRPQTERDEDEDGYLPGADSESQKGERTAR